jgi:hypothetical protein
MAKKNSNVKSKSPSMPLKNNGRMLNAKSRSHSPISTQKLVANKMERISKNVKENKENIQKKNEVKNNKR